MTTSNVGLLGESYPSRNPMGNATLHAATALSPHGQAGQGSVLVPARSSARVDEHAPEETGEAERSGDLERGEHGGGDDGLHGLREFLRLEAREQGVTRSCRRFASV
jgi:hypothetical protein